MWIRRVGAVALLAVHVMTLPRSVFAQASQDRVEALLQQMTLDEKVGQMTQIALDVVSSSPKTDSTPHILDVQKLRQAVVERHVGSIFNVYSSAFTRQHWADVITAIQKMATEETRLRIPLIYGIDAVHGHNYLFEATLFPQNIGMAATWNRDLVRRENAVTAKEMRATGIPWNFSPVLDVGRQPLWSRFDETFGEDVYLASEMGLAAVNGLQGTDADLSDHVAASGKYFLGYSLPLSGKDRTPAWIPDRMLREYVIPPFQRAIDAGLETIMVNSGEINGEPVSASRHLLTDLLRGELGFDGVVVSGWSDVKRLHTMHRVARTDRDAVRMAVEAGIDMSMVPLDYSFANYLIDLVRSGEISEERIDEAVRRILRLKFDLGLFDDPYPRTVAAQKVGSEEFREVSRAAAEESITLLRNEEAVLPLSRNSHVLVTGPGAASLPALFGSTSYTWQGTDEAAYPDAPTIVDALVAKRGLDLVSYVPGTTWLEEVSIGAAVEEAFRSDVVLVVLGEPPSTGKPGDIDELDLPAIQVRLVEALAAVGRPIILVLTENRPRIVRRIVPLVDAALLAYRPGPFGAEAIAGILTGEVNPSGRLPFTYPRYSGSIVPYDHKSADRVDRNGGQNAFSPEWEFGYGLSYTSFSYENLELSADSVTVDDVIDVTVDVTNQGSLSGREVVQVFVRDEYASITPPVKRLRAFDKIEIEPYTTVKAHFSIPVGDLGFWDKDMRHVVEPGRFTVLVGDQTASFVVR